MSVKTDNLKRIAVSPENYSWLAEQGHAGQSFNDVITKLREGKKSMSDRISRPSQTSTVIPSAVNAGDNYQ